MPKRAPRALPPRDVTPRAAIREALVTARDTGAKITARELGAAADIPEKDVYDHLQHLTRSLAREGQRLDVVPAECLACGYVFRDRARHTSPSACPECRSERVAPPSFTLSATGAAPRRAPRARHDEDD